MYNGEEFVSRCLTSIFNQTFQDFQLIIVDDGSTDGSIREIEKFKTEHPNSDFSIIKTHNQGPGQARNLGISHVNRDYIWFIDVDDYLYGNYVIKDAVSELINYKPDIYIFSALETDFKKRIKIWHYANENKLTSIKKDPTLLFKQNWSWNKILKTSFLKESNVMYNNHLMFEDIYFYVDLYQKANSIYVTRDVKYVYVKHKKSLTSSLKNFKGYHKALFHELKGFIKIILK